MKYCVGERAFMLDCARKYFTPAFIKRLIDEICEVGFNAINIHFSEKMGMRLESKQYPWLAGADHTLWTFGPENGMAENDGKFITQDGYVCDDGMNTYIFPPFKAGNVISAPNERVLGAGFCLWCDTPARESEDELLENMRPYFTAIAKKATGN